MSDVKVLTCHHCNKPLKGNVYWVLLLDAPEDAEGLPCCEACSKPYFPDRADIFVERLKD